MAASVAERFIEALRGLEETRDVETMVALYAEQSEVGNVNAPEKFTGQAGAREFWTKYRDTFGEVRSTFRNRIINDARAALEWTTEGTTANGAPFNYEGVSILEIEGDRITRFRAYFDPEALGRQIERAATAAAQ
ncbi:MAG TPA: nuclear transport factor 2 family protein [Pyrinomonadaceae bacterium]|nr:nuclear transport factor 2 family protein [Pyrinomonadaceae bacterium]